jgi:ABC-type transport system involved in multi-copper enzyme maturation permease subunit
MKLLQIFRFELAYQLRRLSTWLFFVVLAVIAFLFVRRSFIGDAVYTEFFLNSPFVITFTMVFCCMFWLVLAAAIAGEIAARDAETGMHPLSYTAPVSKAEYLGGRFLAVFALNALMLLAVPLGILLAVYAPGVDPELIGPFRATPYFAAYCFFVLPNVFIGSAIQFAWATLSRRAIAGYVGSVLLLFTVYGGMITIWFFTKNRELAALLDIFGHIYMTDELVLGWTTTEKNTRLIALEGLLLQSRLLWMGIALGTLAFTYTSFHFRHLGDRSWWRRIMRRGPQALPAADNYIPRVMPVSIRQVRQTFGLATSIRQTIAIGLDSFRTIAKSWFGLGLLAVIAVIAVLLVPQNMHNMGTPLMPRTEYVLTFITAALTDFQSPWVIIPLLIALYAGELVWREREAHLGEITDAAPVTEWALFSGKFLGLGLMLSVWMAFLTIAGMLIQLRLGYYKFEIGLYLQVLYGLQLPVYLLFALLALVIQGLAHQKYVGYLLVLIAYACILFGPMLGLRHHLLIFGSAPRWSYSDMRGFGSSLAPWRWFMLYWAAWGLLLAVLARLLWLRGQERGLRVRFQLARRRFTRPTAGVTALALGLMLSLGTFIFYNTNVLNTYRTPADGRALRAGYERSYSRYAHVPQPYLAGTKLHVEIYPRQQAVDIKGTYQLINGSGTAIDTIHLAPVPGIKTEKIAFNRAAARVLADEQRGHQIYALQTPLQPGDSLQLSFEVHVKPRGFRNDGVNPFMTAKISYVKSIHLLPSIGYQASRELIKPGERRAQGLPARPLIPSVESVAAGQDITGEAGTQGASRIAFEAVVGTDEGQTAIAPGELRRIWKQGKRRYFRYTTDTPIGTEYAFFSSAYTLHEEQWTPPSGAGQPVTIQVYYHSQHAANLDRILRSVRASMNNYTRAFGPYPHGRLLRVIENPGSGMGAHAEPATIDYGEGFSRFNPTQDPRGLDLLFGVIAHEMAHEWQVPHTIAEGAALLGESFAWYAAMGVVEETYGRAHLERLRRFFRQPYPIPPIRQSVPLLRAMDPYAAYRKGPFALFALSQYMGPERVNLAWRRLIEQHRSGLPPLATSPDLYRELQALTPDSLQYLLHDLFEANTVWQLKTEEARAEQAQTGGWQVKLRIRARKVTVDTAGVETELPMDEWVPIGAFAPTGQGAAFGEILYLQQHRIRSGEQTITLTLPRKPADAGIDPYHLLIDLEPFDNVERVKK